MVWEILSLASFCSLGLWMKGEGEHAADKTRKAPWGDLLGREGEVHEETRRHFT